MKLSHDDLLELYVTRLLEDEEALMHRPDPLYPMDNERAGLFALLMIATFLDSIDTRLLKLLHYLENHDECHPEHH